MFYFRPSFANNNDQLMRWDRGLKRQRDFLIRMKRRGENGIAARAIQVDFDGLRSVAEVDDNAGAALPFRLERIKHRIANILSAFYCCARRVIEAPEEQQVSIFLA